MLRRVAGHLAPAPPSPAAQPPLVASPSSAASSVISALAGAAIALAAARMARGVAPAPAPQEPAGHEPAAAGHGGRSPDPNVVQTTEQLRELLPVADAAYGATGLADAAKVLDHLDEQMTTFVESCPFLQLGTADKAGMPFVSPKGDDDGFVMVVNPRNIVIPDRPGNNIVLGLQNILENPRVGVCFVIPGNPITLRLGGKATLRKDPELLRQLAARQIDATLAIQVDIEYSFFHCAKAYMRSRMWEPAAWPAEKQAFSLSPYFAEDPGDEAEIAALNEQSAQGYAKVQLAIDGKAAETSTRRA
eukprot:COSAG06_NODE_60_length_27159_cov_57.986031_17_plen_304_part_00